LAMLDLAGAAPHCSAGASRARKPGADGRGYAVTRAFFILIALLALPLAARAVPRGPAILGPYQVPSEERWAPFYDNMPPCDDSGVLGTISGRFGETQRTFWNSQLSIDGFDQVREIGLRSNGLEYIPRRYCIARATMSDTKERTVIYNVGSETGIIGLTWGVEWCVVGIDPMHAYSPDCYVLRPIIERELRTQTWLGDYGLKARY
jgi:hypothetical protein